MPNRQERDSSVLFPNVAFDVVAIAASAGGKEALGQVLSSLPADFPASILVVQHLPRWRPSQLAEDLKGRTRLIVKQAEENEKLQASTVFVAPANQHLLANPDGTLSLSGGELVQSQRPSADILFTSVANSFKGRAIAVVLTGKGQDGAEGVRAIQNMGGTVIVQERETAAFSDMPEAAILTGKVNLILPLDNIATTVMALLKGRGFTAVAEGRYSSE